MTNMKNVMDLAAGPTAIIGSVTLTDVPIIINVAVGLAALAWYAVRFYDRFVLNKKSDD